MVNVLMTCDLQGSPGPSSSHSMLRSSDASEGHLAEHRRQKKYLLSPCKHPGWNLARTGFWILPPALAVTLGKVTIGASVGGPWVCLMFQ